MIPGPPNIGLPELIAFEPPMPEIIAIRASDAGDNCHRASAASDTCRRDAQHATRALDARNARELRMPQTQEAGTPGMPQERQRTGSHKSSRKNSYHRAQDARQGCKDSVAINT